MAFEGKAVSGITITVDAVTVAKITSLTKSTNVTETEVTGTEDAISGSTAVFQQFTPTAVGKTMQFGGIAIANNSGQSVLQAAVDDADDVVLVAAGTTATGFFTQYEETGQLPGVFTFTASFRVNSVGA